MFISPSADYDHADVYHVAVNPATGQIWITGHVYQIFEEELWPHQHLFFVMLDEELNLVKTIKHEGEPCPSQFCFDEEGNAYVTYRADLTYSGVAKFDKEGHWLKWTKKVGYATQILCLEEIYVLGVKHHKHTMWVLDRDLNPLGEYTLSLTDFSYGSEAGIGGAGASTGHLETPHLATSK